MKKHFNSLSYLQERKESFLGIKDSLPTFTLNNHTFYEVVIKGEKVYVSIDKMSRKTLLLIVKEHKDKEFVFL